MEPSVRNFHVGLYEESLEEASFLYTQRRALRNNPQVSWRALAGFEDRLEAHLDALVIGGTLALDVCRARWQEGDAGEMFACVSLFCRHRQAPLLAEVIGHAAFDDAAKVRAIEDALKDELPEDWLPFVQQALSRVDPKLTPLLAKVSGYRRMPVSDLLLRALERGDARSAPAIAWALSRMKLSSVPQVLRQCLTHPEERLRADALISLLRAGDPNVLAQCHTFALAGTWPHLGLAIGGDRSTARVLRQAVDAGIVWPGSLLALGLLGDLTAVRLLCKYLTHPQLAPFAANALHWITGAALLEETFVPEKVEEDELFPREREAWLERQELPKRADGNPYGTTVVQLSQDTQKWEQWLAENASRFDTGRRYRKGNLVTPQQLLADLSAEDSPSQLRQLAYEELVIRYSCDVAFESDMPVHRQMAVIAEISAWVSRAAAAIEAGRWYLGGRIVE